MTMSKFRLVVSSIILSSASALAVAQTADEHNAHHPEPATTGETSTTAQTPVDPALLEKQMNDHMQTMHAFHEKLQKTSPDERQALMSEHHELMQEGMKMMGMASGGMQSMGMMGGMHSQAAKNHSTEASTAHHTMMLKRMDMMQSMMQMMMDRMPAPNSPNK
ncbi:hypothetical protein [Nitrosomonas eutropha]|uniref:Uncharacterized protein n=2 Tax=Nitrosomonas eutropha TaxID=916 RepID=A0ABX5MFL3_9PROT|nr:hypothetical protein [Nitrosomonas eutropha]ABI58342.1 conserved hypothetical protein [Nitrosomonas eutropha C91]PXV84164.1 hypothetical protein C8R14_10145 [Nitrosomonas eutropha]